MSCVGFIGLLVVAVDWTLVCLIHTTELAFEQFVICNSIFLCLTLPVTQYVGGMFLSATDRQNHCESDIYFNEYCLDIFEEPSW